LIGAGAPGCDRRPFAQAGDWRAYAANHRRRPTWSEYPQYIEKDRPDDAALPADPSASRIFARLRDMCEGIWADEKHQGCGFPTQPSSRGELRTAYIPSRQVPDKAVSLLDTAVGPRRIRQSAIRDD